MTKLPGQDWEHGEKLHAVDPKSDEDAYFTPAYSDGPPKSSQIIANVDFTLRECNDVNYKYVEIGAKMKMNLVKLFLWLTLSTSLSTLATVRP